MKRAFDIVAGTCVLVVTAIPMIVISVKIATESKGGVFYRQERVTTYGKNLEFISLERWLQMLIRSEVRLLFREITALRQLVRF